MEDGNVPDVDSETFSSARRALIVPTFARPGKDRPDEEVAPIAERLLPLLPATATRVRDPAGSQDKGVPPRVLGAMAPDGAALDGALAAIISDPVPALSGVILGSMFLVTVVTGAGADREPQGQAR